MARQVQVPTLAAARQKTQACARWLTDRDRAREAFNSIYSAATAFLGSGLSSRKRGRTSFANSVIFATVSLWSRKPPWPNYNHSKLKEGTIKWLNAVRGARWAFSAEALPTSTAACSVHQTTALNTS
jgi:hypothetical protein